MDSAAALSSAAKAAAATSLRSAYQRAASSASLSASARNSSMRIEAGGTHDSATGLRPRNRFRLATFEAFNAPANFLDPSGFSIFIDLLIQALDQFSCKGGTSL